MNAPSQTLICNPQIEWSKLPYICLLSAFPRLFPPPLLDLLQVDLTRSLANFSSRAILNRTKRPFWKSTPLFVWECAFDREKMLKVGGKKEKKRKRAREKERKKESKKERKHTNSIARIRAGASSSAVCFTCLKLHHAAPRKQDTFDRRISCHDHATHRLKKKHFSCGFRSK